MSAWKASPKHPPLVSNARSPEVNKLDSFGSWASEHIHSEIGAAQRNSFLLEDSLDEITTARLPDWRRYRRRHLLDLCLVWSAGGGGIALVWKRSRTMTEEGMGKRKVECRAPPKHILQ
jgi:hypothetical protein